MLALYKDLLERYGKITLLVVTGLSFLILKDAWIDVGLLKGLLWILLTILTPIITGGFVSAAVRTTNARLLPLVYVCSYIGFIMINVLYTSITIPEFYLFHGGVALGNGVVLISIIRQLHNNRDENNNTADPNPPEALTAREESENRDE